MLEAIAPTVIDTPIGPLLFTPKAPTNLDVMKAYGMTHLWRMSEASGDFADPVGSMAMSLNGSGIVRAVAGAISGDTDAAAKFQADVTYAEVPTSPSLSQAETWSVGGWCKLSALGAAGTNHVLLYIGQSSGSPSQYLALVVSSDGYPRVEMKSSAGTTYTATSPTPVTANTYRFISATYDGTSLCLYVGGVLVATTPASGIELTSASFCARIAGAPNMASPAAADRTIDEVFVCAYTMDSTAMANIYELQSATLGLSYRFMLNKPPATGVDARRDVDPFPVQDGGDVGPAYADVRVITLNATVIARSASGLATGAQKLRGRINRLMREEGTMRWWASGYNGVLFDRVMRHESPTPGDGNASSKPIQFSLITGTVPALKASVTNAHLIVNHFGGVTSPTVSPMREANTGNRRSLSNTGDADAPVIWTLTGPFSRAEINNDAGDTMAISYNLADGETITIDTNAREIFTGDELTTDSDIYGYIEPGSTFFPIKPGTTTIGFYASDAGTNTAGRVATRSAYMP